MNDERCGRPKFYGYVIFETKDAVDRALEQEIHLIKGRRIDVQRTNRTYLPDHPKPIPEYYHALDPHEVTMKPRASKERPQARHHKYGFHEHCPDLERDRKYAAMLDWKTQKLNLSDDVVKYELKDKRQLSKEHDTGNSNTESPPNRSNGSLGFVRNMGSSLSGVSKQPLRAREHRSKADPEA
uniref:RRM domain-containing protein n=1 Tax=Steinernema glaseri TaxID=37863 RepID=A0A1I8ARJ0_9BILA